MAKYVDLFFCGDSFTWGEELQGPEQNHGRIEKERFSGVLSNMLGKTHQNISRSGTSNDWIVKKTIEWFETGNSCDTAIIQFSHHYRWMWYDKDGQHHHMPANLGKNNSHIKFVEKYDAQKAYMENVISSHFAAENYWKNMFVLRNYLKDKCKVIHLSLITPPFGYVGKDYKKNFWCKSVGKIDILALTPMLKSDDENWCPNLKNNILDSNQNNRFAGNHPSAKGHRVIANHLHQFYHH